MSVALLITVDAGLRHHVRRCALQTGAWLDDHADFRGPVKRRWAARR